MFGRKIKHLLEMRDISQAELVRLSGINKNTISDLINDKQTNPTVDTIKTLAKILRVDTTYFFEENAYTPLEALDLPDHIKEFILTLDSMDYLIMAEKFKGKKIPPEVIEKIVATYEEVMKTK